MINIGAYTQGSNPEVDQAINKISSIWEFLQQGVEVREDLSSSFEKLQKLVVN